MEKWPAEVDQEGTNEENPTRMETQDNAEAIAEIANILKQQQGEQGNATYIDALHAEALRRESLLLKTKEEFKSPHLNITEEFKDDYEVVRSAFEKIDDPNNSDYYEQFKDAYEYASEHITKSKRFLLELARFTQGDMFQFILDQNQDNPNLDEEVLLTYLSRPDSAYRIKNLPERFSSDEQFMLKAIEKNAVAYRLGIDDIKNLPQIILQAASQDIRILDAVPDKNVLMNEDLMLKLMDVNVRALSESGLKSDPAFILRAAKEHPECIEYADPTIQTAVKDLLENTTE